MTAQHAFRRSVLETLRVATRPRHANLAADSAMTRLFDPAYTVAEYRTHLGRVLGFFEPLECAAGQAAGSAYSVRALERSGAIREDLLALGATTREIAAVERCRDLSPIEPSGLRGYAYVTLGSMRGGRVIAARLRSVLGPDASYRFYDAGGEGFDARWASFCADLEEHGKDQTESICATAAGILDAYAAWFKRPGVPAAGRATAAANP
jgi:heme oxygenase